MESNLNPMPSQSIPSSTDAPLCPLPTTIRKPRRRAREVSSRYLSTPAPAPIVVVGSSSPPHPSTSSIFQHQKIRRSPSIPSSPEVSDSESDRFADENQPAAPATAKANRSLETPVFLGTTQRKRAVRLFGDNGSGDERLKTLDLKANSRRRQRPGTPMVTAGTNTVATPKVAVFSQNQSRFNPGVNTTRKITTKGRKFEVFTPSREIPFRSDDVSSETSSTFGDSEVETCSISNQGGLCDSPPISGSRIRQQVSEFRSSMPEADLLPSMSSRKLIDGVSSRQNEGEDVSCRPSSSSYSFCHRSLNLSLSSCQPNPFNSMKSGGRIVQSRICLPPQPPCKLGGEVKKGKKGSGRQEDVHNLRLLDNKYLQWRFVNARAQQAADARQIAAERSLYGLSEKISEMQSSVVEKRIELDELRRIKNLSTILECQMPFLDEWTNLEADHSSCLSGATKALQDASIRLPITGNVKADIKELKEVIGSATNMLESLNPTVTRFLPKAKGIEDIISDLARQVTAERTLIEECGNLLSEAHKLQVTECSLRSQLIQAKQRTAAENNPEC